MITVVKFLNKGRYCDLSGNRIQIEVLDLLNRKHILLSFNKYTKLFPKMYNTMNGYSPEFNAIISYDEDNRNRVKIIDDKKYVKKYAMYLI